MGIVNVVVKQCVGKLLLGNITFLMKMIKKYWSTIKKYLLRGCNRYNFEL